MIPFGVLALLIGCGEPECGVDQSIVDGECIDTTKPLPSAGWHPAPGTTWQIQFSGTLDTSLEVEMYDFDLFDTPDAVVAQVLPDRALVCYFSAGSYEDWRPDAADFPASALGDPLDGWEGEWWLDVSDPTVREIMTGRLDRARARGCDAVDPDNVNGWENPTGFAISRDAQIDYNRFLADEAHQRGLSIGLKNDQLQLDQLADWYDFAINEECATYDECQTYAAFTTSGKAVFHIEYVDKEEDVAERANEVCGEGPNLDTLIKEWSLGPEYFACR